VPPVPLVPAGRGRLPPVTSASFASPLHDRRAAAWLGLALGASFTTCFLTGLLSHLIQNPPGWFTWPSRPAGLYRVTQGVHVATGIASVPLLLTKLWVVYPSFWTWPPVRSVAHAVERVSLVPLVGGALFMLFSGVANIARWYPWHFSFPVTHYWVSWITMGGLVVHVGAKLAVTAGVVRSRRRPAPPEEAPPPGRAGQGLTRRGLLGTAFATSGLLTLVTLGQTVRPLDRLGLLAPRRPKVGPQGLPVNKSAVGARVVEAARDPAYRLVVEGRVGRRLSLSIDDLRALPQFEETLPIACVEGWSSTATWRGVRVRDLLELAGAREGAEVLVESLQPRGAYRSSVLNEDHAADRATLLALDLFGEPLHIDHGYPVRLIGPNRPGVQQTKWVSRLVVR
ncbi:MAG: molybdopterin-dependent oxidoreductase, partial [Acidimicrobiales bacterium]